MKYTIYAITEGKVKMFCYAAASSNQDWSNEEKVAEANTVAEAKKIIKDLGSILLLA